MKKSVSVFLVLVITFLGVTLSPAHCAAMQAPQPKMSCHGMKMAKMDCDSTAGETISAPLPACCCYKQAPQKTEMLTASLTDTTHEGLFFLPQISATATAAFFRVKPVRFDFEHYRPFASLGVIDSLSLKQSFLI